MLKRRSLVFLLFAFVFVTITTACSNDETEAKEDFSAQIEVVENFIRVAYFDEGKYEDFQALYADPSKANTEEEFNTFRESNEPKDVFPSDYDSVESVSKHLVANKVDENNVNIYWLEDPEEDKVDEAKSVWSLKKVEDKWLLN